MDKKVFEDLMLTRVNNTDMSSIPEEITESLTQLGYALFTFMMDAMEPKMFLQAIIATVLFAYQTGKANKSLLNWVVRDE